jgi:transposase
MITLSYLPPEHKIRAQIRQGLFVKGIKCLKCGKRYSYKINNRYYCKKCRYKFSLKTLLPFKASKLSFNQLWLLLYCFLKQLSFQDTEAITELSHVTIRRWFRRFSNLIPEQKLQLMGMVEMDEAFIGRQRFNNQTIVLGAVEKKTGRTVFKPVKDRESGSLDRFILKHVAQGSMLQTDAYVGYEHITEFFGYGHEVVNHSMGHFGITNHVENRWMRLRRFIRKVYHHIWKEHLKRILKEFAARISHPVAFDNQLSFLSFVFQVS